jgi:prepilin-type N-terminal cleavage/methylation domain-containing protein
VIDRKDRIVKNDAAGFTLVELMIALVVIAIGVMALSGVQTRSSRDVYATGRSTRALALAQQRIEIKRAGGYAAAVTDSGQQDNFEWIARVDSAGIDLKSIDVTVTWPEQMQTQSVRLTTLISAR